MQNNEGQLVAQGAGAGGFQANNAGNNGGNGDQDMVESEAYELSFSRVDEFQQDGINVSDINKLKQAGFHTAQSIVGVMRT